MEEALIQCYLQAELEMGTKEGIVGRKKGL